MACPIGDVPTAEEADSHRPASARGTDKPSRVAGAIARSAWGERASRVGLAARGLVYLLLGYLVARIALGALGSGGTSKPASGPGVAQAVAAEPSGRPVLFALAVGLECYALFSLLDAILHHDDETPRAKRWGDRLLSAWGFVIYTAFAVYSFSTALSSSGGSATAGPEVQQKTQWSARVLRWPGGPVWMGLLGVVLLVIAAFLVARAVRRSFRTRLELGAMSAGVRSLALVTGTIGYLARAGLFGTVGGFVLSAGVENDPVHGQGVDGSIRLLARSAAGPVLLWCLAIGLGVYGVYMFFEARYRRV